MAKGCVGLYDRHSAPADTQTGASGSHSGWRAVFSGFVPTQNGPEGIGWKDFQPSLAYAPSYIPGGGGGAHGTIATGVIEPYLNTVYSYNTTGSPALLWNILLRVFFGVQQPAWVKALGGTAGWGNLLSNSADGTTMIAGWTANFRQLANDFFTQLAAYVPTDSYNAHHTPVSLDLHPYLGAVSYCVIMSHYPEPLLMSGASGTATAWTQAELGNPSNATVQQYYGETYQDFSAAWPNTPVEFSHNPAVFGGETFTETMIAYEQVGGSLGTGTFTGNPNAVLGNNSLRETNYVPHTPVPTVFPTLTLPWPGVLPCPGPFGTYKDGLGYTAMYKAMAKYGTGNACIDLGFTRQATPFPIMFQTDVYSKSGGTILTLKQTCDYGLWLGAQKIELPTGYSDGSPSDFAPYYAKLLANVPGGSPAPGPVIQTVQGGTSASATTLVVQNALTTAGSALVLVVGARASSTPTVSISGGGTWVNDGSVNTASNNGNLSLWHLVPGSPVSANGITITSNHSGSIEYEFYEVTGLAAAPFESIATAAAGTTSTAPTVSKTPTHASDFVVGGILWPGSGATTISGLPAMPPWTSDSTVTGVA